MPITRALISVSDKTGLIPFAKALVAKNIALLSTGGTASALRDAGIAVTDVSEHTGFPEIMDGRVKTLHPRVHGGILALRDEHAAAMQQHDISPIDLVVVSLYPFEETVAGGGSFEECVEQIDIGGPAMIRAAAKNYGFVTVIVDAGDYDAVLTEIAASGDTTPATRKKLAAKAYARTSAYDSAIARWYSGQLGEPFPERITLSATRKATLHYGENPHQKAALYAAGNAEGTLVSATQAYGAPLSYNNVNDASAAWQLVREFSEPAVAIIKHANPCGVAVGASIEEAFARALACDPVSAYGGIIAVNRPLSEAFAKNLGSLFTEVMIAPAADAAALALLTKRKKLKLLLTGCVPAPAKGQVVVTVDGGFLVQDQDDRIFESELRTVTRTTPTPLQLADLRFAFTVAKHVKSNTIVLARGSATLGIGAGQMSRIDSTRIACWKAKEAGVDIKGAVLASDAFFPFADNVEMAAEAGIAAIIQPGGSIRDEEVIAAADKAGIAMIFTGIRHFRH